MNWFSWLLVAFFGLGAFMTVANVGKPKKPTEAEVAAIVVVIDALLILGVVMTR